MMCTMPDTGFEFLTLLTTFLYALRFFLFLEEVFIILLVLFFYKKILGLHSGLPSGVTSNCQ